MVKLPIAVLAALAAFASLSPAAAAENDGRAPMQPASIPEAPVKAKVRVAVIDTGVAATSLLADRIVASYDAVSPESPRAKLSSDHGTWVASILAMNSSAPFEIVSFRVDKRRGCMGGLCPMDTDAIRDSVLRAIELKVDIIQISSYGRMDSKVRAVFVEAARHGIKIVFSAGNQGGVALPGQIAKEAGQNVFVVGSLDADGRHSDFSASPSRKASYFVWRRGEHVPTQNSDGTEALVDGTSFAAPLYTAELINGMPIR